MISRSLFALLFVATPLLAQDAAPAVIPPASVAQPEISRNVVLRGITRVYLDVAMTDGARADDGDLRGDLRDVVELELRRAGIVIGDGLSVDPASRAPALRLEVKFDRGAGRFAARLYLSVRDQVVVTRNHETLVAEIWSIDRDASAAMDTGLSKEIRSRARDMVTEFVAALRRANGVR